MTRSELFYFSAGVVVGAVGRQALPVLKEKYGPLLAAALAGMSNGASDVYGDLAKVFAEKVETVQDAVSEMHAPAETNGKHEPATSPVGA